MVTKLVANGQVFTGLGTSEMFEIEFERLIAQAAPQLFPGWHFVPFQAPVTSSRGDTRKPDFALIDQRYRAWWVVEIEMAQHPFENHVMPQVEVLWDGLFGEEHVRYLLEQAPHLDQQALQSMMRGEHPRVYVLVNMPCPEWETPLVRFGAALGVVQVLRSDQNRYALCLDGFQPEPPGISVTRCHRDSTIQKFMVVESPAALPRPVVGPLTIQFDGVASNWNRTDTKSSVYLVPQRGDPLGSSKVAEIQCRDDGTLVWSVQD